MVSESSLNQRIFDNIQKRFKEITTYRVQAGDTLSGIIHRYYGISMRDKRYTMALLHMQYVNPKITNTDLIYPGQLIHLPPLPSREESPIPYCSVDEDPSLYDPYSLKDLFIGGLTSAHTLERLATVLPQKQEEFDAFWTLSWLHQNYDYLSISGGAGFNMWGNLVAQSNQKLIGDVKSLYEQHKSGVITKGQYDYRRRQALKEFSKRVGPFEKLLLKGKTSTEAIRIARSRALPATAKIDQQLGRLSKMAKVAQNGGLLLTGVGVAVGCYNMAHVNSKQEKNEIFVETVSSSVAGVISSMAISVLLVSNPVGWGIALVLGASSAVGSYLVGKGAVNLYNRHYQQVDIAALSGVNALCQ